VTANSDLDLATNNNANVDILDNLTLNHVTVYLGNASGTTLGQMLFDTTETLGGTGTVVFGKNASNGIFAADSMTWTIGSGITIRGSSGNIGNWWWGNSGTIINQGTILADDSGGPSGYAYDTGYTTYDTWTGGTPDAIDTSAVSDTTPASVYQTYRTGDAYDWCPLTYPLDDLTPGTTYTVRLLFAEPSYSSAGQREFDVGINGTPVLMDFDIVAAAGGKDKAVVEEFTATADGNGQIAVDFNQGAADWPLVNGIELFSGGTRLQAIDCGLVAGGTIGVDSTTFINEGTLAVSNGETLNVSGLTGNLGHVSISGSGSTLSLSGANYIIDQGLSAPAGTTVSLGRTWTNVSTITATGATLSLGDQSSSSTNTWTNSGTIAATDSTVNLGGWFTVVGLGTFSRTNSTVNLTGTLDNTGTTLTLDAATGSWNLAGGTIKGGAYSSADGAELVFTSAGGTLDGVTANSDLDLATNDATVHIVDGLTLSGTTVYLGSASGTTSGQMGFDTTETLGGTGTVVLGKNGSNEILGWSGTTWTIASGITIRGSSGNIGNWWWGNSGTIINQGTILADDSGGPSGYAYDTGYTTSNTWTGGTSDAIDTSAVSDTTPASVYQTYRTGYGDYWSPLTYTLDDLTPGTTYTVRLLFADSSYDSAGEREFNVGINGTQVLTDFDIVAAAGGKDKAVVEEFTATADGNGQIAIDFSSGAMNWPLINGIELLSGGTRLQAIDCGLVAGGTIGVDSTTFINEGTLAVSNGETLNVSGLTGNLGHVSISGSGSTLSLSGANYIIDQGLSAPAGTTVSLGRTWTNVSTITATGATLNLGDQSSSSTNLWSNTGTIAVTDTTVNFGGWFTTAGLGTFSRTDGTLNLIGTLDNTGQTLTLDATTGSCNLMGGTLLGGAYSSADGAELVFTSAGGTLDGVTANSDLDLATNNANVHIVDGLTLSGATVYLGSASGTTSGQMLFDTTETLDGTGTVVFGKNSSNWVYSLTGTTWTIGSGITIRGSSGNIGNWWWGNSGTIINQGTILADDSGGPSGYAYDAGYTTSNTWADSTSDAIDTSAVSDTTPASVYQTYRYGYGYDWSPFTYTLDDLTPGTIYTVRLLFAEPAYSSVGQREFNVGINGTQVLTDFDIVAAAGAKDKAVVEEFTAMADGNGQIAVDFSSGSADIPLVNGIELLSGGTLLQAIDCGLLAGGTITINPSTFTNEGTIGVSNGETLNVSGSTGNLTDVSISGSGSTLSLSGTNYVVDQGLSAPAGTTVSLGGTWTNVSVITADGATLNLGDQSSSSTNLWSNTGTITATDTTLNFGGWFTTAGLGTFSPTDSTLNLIGTLDNTGETLTLDAATGSCYLMGGTLKGGTYSSDDGAELVFTASGGTLDGVTANGDLDLATNNANVYVVDGLTLSGATVYLGNASGTTYGQMYFGTTETLGGTGTVVFGTDGSNRIFGWNGTTWTIGSGITIRGTSGTVGNWGANETIINQGTILADIAGGTIAIGTGMLTNEGTLEATAGTLAMYTSAAINNSGKIVSSPTAAITIYGNLLGDTSNSSLYNPQGTLTLNGSGTDAAPQLLEVMGRDLGFVPNGFTNNFAYGTLALANNTYVQLVDQSQNTTSGASEALYVDLLVVPAGTTLDLNHLHVYARATQIDGTVINGTINPVAPPTVTNVLLSSTNWNSTFLSYLASLGSQNVGGYSIPVGGGSQLVALPWGNINQIKVVFSENVAVDQADLRLSGVNTLAYNVSGGTFSYDPITFTATWTLPQAIGSDKLMLALNADGSDPIEDSAGNRLDGEWTNPTSRTDTGDSVYPSGNGTAGGDFHFRLNVLPGDATQNGSVTGADLIKLLANYNQSGMTWLQGDFTGDGMVTGADLIKLLANYNQTLPSAEPTAGSFPANVSLMAASVPEAVSGTAAISVTPVSTVAMPARSTGTSTNEVAATASPDGVASGQAAVSATSGGTEAAVPAIASVSRFVATSQPAYSVSESQPTAPPSLSAQVLPNQSTIIVAASPTAPSSTLRTANDVKPVVSATIAGWPGAGSNAAPLQKLTQAPFVIGDLPGSSPREAAENRIDRHTNVAGNGSFVDFRPASVEESRSSSGSHALQAIDARAVDKIDLPTVVEHELGHVAGVNDGDALTDDILSGVLGIGVRGDASQVDAALAS
jgi:hypothetical protein